MDLAFDIVSWICLLAGSAFCLIGAFGLLRLPEFYSRTHAASVTDTMGAGLVLFGLLLQSGDQWTVAVKLGFVLVFMLMINPAASHALVKAAYAGGVRVEHPQEEDDADTD